MKKLLLIWLTILSISYVTPALSEQASKESVMNLMGLSGAGELGVQMMEQMLPALKKLAPDAKQQFWDDFMREVDANELSEMIAPVYQKYLSEEEVIAIIAFYNSPAGRKLVQVQPDIMQDSMLAGQQWGRQLAERVINKYRAQAAASEQ